MPTLITATEDGVVQIWAVNQFYRMSNKLPVEQLLRTSV